MASRFSPAALMLQGTGSDVGKSLLVAGLARAFTQRGLKVKPFKPQNMSNNAAVTKEGGEIGRAQALQARACGVVPEVDMNPILLKPQSDAGSQMIIQGRVAGTVRAAEYYSLKDKLLPKVMESFGRLGKTADLILVEGAGSAAEANLRPGDIANMGFAEVAKIPVILVADIDRGGALASIIGTWLLLDPNDQKLLKGYIINKFRGDQNLFKPATKIIRQHTGLDCLGIVEFFDAARQLPAEDALALEQGRYNSASEGKKDKIKIVVPRLPRIANFDDLDPLTAEPDVAMTLVSPGNPLPLDADLILLPGSKGTVSDLTFLRTQGWDIDIAAHHRRGGKILGLCGGYQMLGRRIADPLGVEGIAGEISGLGLLDIETTLAPHKILAETEATEVATKCLVRGYEIHMGVTQGPDCTRPMLHLVSKGRDQSTDGATSSDGRVSGCYLHGLFTADDFRHAFLKRLSDRRLASNFAYEAHVEKILNSLADHLNNTVDIDRLWSLAQQRL